MFGGVAPLAIHPTHAAADDAVDSDPYALADAYGHEAAERLALTLRVLETAGFAKARASQWSAFERVLSGAAWALQQLVAREDAVAGRVQWDALFQPHAALKARLGFAQEVARCVDALPRTRPAPPVQPHQLLLQDFGDVGAVHRLVQWLVDQLESATPHLDAVRVNRGYQRVLAQPLVAGPVPVKSKASADVQFVQNAFRPRRKWQVGPATDAADEAEEDEDALVQRCLLEYGERVSVAAATVPPPDERKGDTKASKNDLMAQLASEVAAAAVSSARTRPSRRNRGASVAKGDADFEIQYERARQQAAVEQQTLGKRQRAREVQLLRQAVAVVGPEPSVIESTLVDERSGRLRLSLETERQALDAAVAQLIADKRGLETRTQDAQAQAAAVAQAVAAVEADLAQVAAVEAAQDAAALPLLTTLTALVARNEALKRQRTAFRAQCREEETALSRTNEATATAEEALRVREVEQLHVQMAAKHRELRVALAHQTRAVQRQMRRVDDVPTRVELLQYETRFRELSDEVALTLDETRKYFCTYNALKTALAFLENEVALLESIRTNFDAAMASKPATVAFFAQLDAITTGVRGSVAKQLVLRAEHERRVEALDCQYQLLLGKERAYVDAVRAFQRECEKNERLVARLQ